MKTIRTILAFVYLALSFQSFGKTLVISDIDDTLKISHVLMLYDQVDTSISYDNHFIGMSHVFWALKNNNDVEFAYVSNAPRWLMLIPHQMFLEYNKYPLGTLYLRSSVWDQTHKMTTISNLVQNMKPDLVVMVGDNGEEDTVIYKNIVSKFPGTRFQTFIHQVYSSLSKSETGKKLEAGQKGFATSIDLAFDLQALGLIQATDVGQISEQIIPQILQQDMNAYYGELAFPDWMDCRDFLLQNNNALLVSAKGFQVQSALIEQYKEKLKARCSTPSPWSYD